MEPWWYIIKIPIIYTHVNCLKFSFCFCYYYYYYLCLYCKTKKNIQYLKFLISSLNFSFSHSDKFTFEAILGHKQIANFLCLFLCFMMEPKNKLWWKTLFRRIFLPTSIWNFTIIKGNEGRTRSRKRCCYFFAFDLTKRLNIFYKHQKNMENFWIIWHRKVTNCIIFISK